MTPHTPSWGFGGPLSVTVGGRDFTVPPGAAVRRVRDGQLAYVLDGSTVHAFIAEGELPMSADLQKMIRRKHFAT
jgi:hypothetical protein